MLTYPNFVMVFNLILPTWGFHICVTVAQRGQTHSNLWKHQQITKCSKSSKKKKKKKGGALRRSCNTADRVHCSALTATAVSPKTLLLYFKVFFYLLLMPLTSQAKRTWGSCWILPSIRLGAQSDRNWSNFEKQANILRFFFYLCRVRPVSIKALK